MIEREAIYSGEVVHLSASDVSLALVASVRQLICDRFGQSWEAMSAFRSEGFFARLAAVREELESRRFALQAREILASCGLPDGNAIDHVRLRAVMDGAHEIPAAEPAFTAHRDTWYANPQCQINWWIPLHDLTREQSFQFFPDLFETPVANNSRAYDYDEWIAKAGWQGAAERVYPAPAEDLDDSSATGGFEAAAGDLIVFSAAHLHQTMPNTSGRTRFSLDFRSVHLADHAAGRGAANVDNESTGSALADYRQVL